MAVGLQTGVPWTMCKQDDAPNPVINTCNGMKCGQTFVGPNSPNKPSIWSENWTTFYQLYGKNTRTRSPEDIAYQVALFISKKYGSFVNYYMYHGGTNFGRTASAYVPTSYYGLAPLDEYEPLLRGTPTSSCLGEQQEVITQYNTRSTVPVTKLNTAERWKQFTEPVPSFGDTSLRSDTLLEQMNTTKDASDYLWFQRNSSDDDQPMLNVTSLAHVLHVFVNGLLVGSAHGTPTSSITLETKVSLNNGINNVSLLSVMVGLPTKFDAPGGTDPVVLYLGSMGKGEAWVNGQSIGRYWVSFTEPAGNPTQTWYNVPRSFLKPVGNLLVLLDEEYGNPLDIVIGTTRITKVCGHVSDSHLPSVTSWKGHYPFSKKYEKYRGRRPKVRLHCPRKTKISRIIFASLGTPSGDCESYAIGSCHSSNSRAIVEKVRFHLICQI
ncbi:hypothetical protein RHSIM_Rhsim06G0102900 [Rhododendron simsii]|uniref:beta-galactosidase n=1 Tax=Rhododendron simsii TaxID=118357 RepID=A0A834LKP5_RHOSS|nr:hypothetical protein RHSIM_Rhsim06G0102900 [Rhododendron simsii]